MSCIDLVAMAAVLIICALFSEGVRWFVEKC